MEVAEIAIKVLDWTDAEPFIAFLYIVYIEKLCLSTEKISDQLVRILEELLKRISNHVSFYHSNKEDKTSAEQNKRKLSNLELHLPISKAIGVLVKFCPYKNRIIVETLEQMLEGWIK